MVMYILAVILAVAWAFNMAASHIGSALQALVAFIGMAVCLGLAGIIGALEKRDAAVVDGTREGA